MPTPKQAAPLVDLLSQLVVPTFVISADSRVLTWNRACEVLTGMRAEEVVGTAEHWRAFYDHPRPCLADLIATGRTGEIPALYASHDGSALSYGGIHAENWCVMPLRGVKLYLAIDAGPVHDEDGNLVAVIETLRDLTDWKESEARVAERTKELQEANEVLRTSRLQIAALDRVAGLGRLTAGLAHEVKTPIAATMNSLDSARSLTEELTKSIGHAGVTEDDLREIARELQATVHRAEQTTERVGQIIRRVREHTHGLNATSSTEFSVLERVRATEGLVAHLLKRSQGSRIDVSGVAANAVVLGDVGKFDQILLNLVVNAIEAGLPTGKGALVSIATAQEARSVLVVSVQDDGPGFSPEARARLFQPMYTTKATGTGLGLAISRELAEGAFGGSLTLAPSTAGARFELRCGRPAQAQSHDAYSPSMKKPGAD